MIRRQSRQHGLLNVDCRRRGWLSYRIPCSRWWSPVSR